MIWKQWGSHGSQGRDFPSDDPISQRFSFWNMRQTVSSKLVIRLLLISGLFIRYSLIFSYFVVIFNFWNCPMLKSRILKVQGCAVTQAFGPGSIPCQIMWDLWWGRFSLGASVSSTSSHSSNCSTFINDPLSDAAQSLHWPRHVRNSAIMNVEGGLQRKLRYTSFAWYFSRKKRGRSKCWICMQYNSAGAVWYANTVRW
jgi:hypothetical protein